MMVDGLFLAVFGAGSAFWLMWALGRLNRVWIDTQKQKNELDTTRVAMSMQLVKRGEDLVRIQNSGSETAERLAEFRAEVAKRKRDLTVYVPKAPPEIFVASEYASSKDDKAWVVELGPGGTARARGVPASAKRHYLVWAVDQGAAISRARNVITDEPGYEVQNVLRYV